MTKVTTFIIAMLVAAQASAFNLRETEDGDLVRWHKLDIEIGLDPSLEALGPIDDVERAIMMSFEQWSNEADLVVDFYFVRVNCPKPGYDRDDENYNCVTAQDKAWSDGEDVGATTVLTYSPKDGEIVDADIVFNTSVGRWSTEGEVGALDIRNVATHEVGHLLGLEHSEIHEATMYATTNYRDLDKRTLHDDDIDGSSELYEDLVEDGLAAAGACDARSVAAGGTPNAWFGFLFILMFIGTVRKVLRHTRSLRISRND